jgi:hypothetical protein
MKAAGLSLLGMGRKIMLNLLSKGASGAVVDVIGQDRYRFWFAPMPHSSTNK